MPAWTLCRALTAMSRAVSDSVIRAISSLPAVDAAKPGDPLDKDGRVALVLAPVAAQEHVLFERVLEVGEGRGADGVQRRRPRARPPGPSRRPAAAAEPCQTPSIRVALPLTAAASGNGRVDQERPGASASFRLVSVSDWFLKGTLRTTFAVLCTAPALS